MTKLREYQKRHLKSEMLKTLINRVKTNAKCSVTVCFLDEIFGDDNQKFTGNSAEFISSNEEFLTFLDEYNFHATINGNNIHLTYVYGKQDNKMKKSSYIFNTFDFDAYRKGNKAAKFTCNGKENWGFRADIENELLQYPDCKELKKALKLYKLLDKYAK